MTETLVHVLATAGRVDLDAPVERYLPGFTRGPRGGKPTVRHLLAHRAGVPHRVTDAIEETQVLSPSNIVEGVRAKGLLFEPGTIEGRRYYIPASGSIMRFRRDLAGVVDAIVSIGGGGQETVLPKSGGR